MKRDCAASNAAANATAPASRRLRAAPSCPRSIQEITHQSRTPVMHALPRTEKVRWLIGLPAWLRGPCEGFEILPRGVGPIAVTPFVQQPQDDRHGEDLRYPL